MKIKAVKFLTAMLVMAVNLLNVLNCSVVIASPAALPGPVGFLAGNVSDARTEEPITWAYILIEDINVWESTGEDGLFHFENPLPVGQYVIKTYRFGYQESLFDVNVSANDTVRIQLKLSSSPILGNTVVVEAENATYESELQRPDVLVSGRKLQQNLGQTIAQTIDYEPGVAQRTMGPAPARPVIRGLSGDRLLILEDGERTGDLSATSADHAVVIEPMTTERIEVIRGPEAMIFGSNTLGGVVNVVRGYIPNHIPNRITGAMSLQGESVSSGYSGGANLTIPLSPFTLRVDGSYRHASDIQTPLGSLLNTASATANASMGISYLSGWGHVGVAGSVYKSEYGIPPDPLGGHPSGVNIDLERQHIESHAEIVSPHLLCDRIELHHTYTRYYHAEREESGDLGMEFGIVTHTFSSAHHLKRVGRLKNGKFGIRGEYRDFASGGLTFTPASRELSLAAYMYQEVELGKVSLNGTVRYDHKQVTPDETRSSRLVGNIRKRRFGDVSGSLGVLYDLTKTMVLGASMMRTFRAPGIEELFSEGPHLAAYTYEVGQTDLRKENGLGSEVFMDLKHARGDIHIALFRNDIHGYIFPENTGDLSWRRADLFVYQYVGKHALMHGIETSFNWQLAPAFSANGSVSYVQGDLTNDDVPIPRIPPLEGKVRLAYRLGQLELGMTTRAGSKQDRLGEFEQTTDGYVVFDLGAQYHFSSRSFLHVFSLNINNIGDTEYRKHLNRVKEIMPEPGRNAKLLYKVFF